MEWRCEWCGKPHADDDPPCDNCGHGSFEKAVVREPAGGTTGSTTVWVCTECGREHPKHSPPCSRCGNTTLERTEVAFDDVAVQQVGYRDLLTTRYALGLVAVVIFGGVLVLGLAGVIDVPGISTGVPTVSDVPGNASNFNGASLAVVERAYLDQLNDLRVDQGSGRLSRDERLDDVARYFNQRRAKSLAGTGSIPADEELLDLLEGSCRDSPTLYSNRVAVPPSVNDPTAIGDRIASRSVEDGAVNVAATRGSTGIDVHALDEETVLLTQISC